MNPGKFLFNNRLLFAVLFPVVIVGIIFSFVSIKILTPPLVDSLQNQTDIALYHTSDVLISICEERFGDLIELRLDNDPEMQNAYLQEAVQQIKVMNKIHPDIKVLIMRSGENLLKPQGENGNITWEGSSTIGESTYGEIIDSTIQGEPVRLIDQYYPFWDLHLISLISKNDYNAPVIQVRRIVAFGTFGVFITVFVTLLLLFLWRINKPLKKIISATEDVASGHFVRTDVKGDDEIARVSMAFNEMVESLEKDKHRIGSILDRLKDSEEQYRILTEKTLAYVAVIKDGSCKFINARMLKALEYEHNWIYSNDFFNIVDDADRKILKKIVTALQSGKEKEKHLECRFQTSSSEILWVELQANQIMYQDEPSVLIHGIDITSRKEERQKRVKLEIQLEQAKRLEALGTLAGGVAHDFNNMLGGILGAAEMLALHIPEDSKISKYQKLIVQSASRAATLTEQLLSFSRRTPKSSTPVDIHEIISETLVLFNNTVDKRIRIVKALEAQECTIIGDPSQLQNVILNLSINGTQAMPEGGTLTITTQNVELDEEYQKVSSFELHPGTYIEIEVSDTGQGIQPEHLSRIFDPFFTTKEKGKGTGLGLASVYGVIQQHGGAIEVTSKENLGTAFTILLPVTHAEKQAHVSPPVQIQGSGRILVVDDEEVMRTTAKALLEDLGYEIVLAANGKQALEKFQQERGKIDLVLLDMIMPEMNGKDCFKELRMIEPDIKIILSSGFTREDDLRELQLSGLSGFIRKPYRSSNLSQIIYDALGGSKYNNRATE